MSTRIGIVAFRRPLRRPGNDIPLLQPASRSVLQTFKLKLQAQRYDDVGCDMTRFSFKFGSLKSQ